MFGSSAEVEGDEFFFHQGGSWLAAHDSKQGAAATKEEKAKHQLTKPEIQAVADKFGVTYQEALQDAKNQGYQVPK